MENKDYLESEKTIIGHLIRFPESAFEIMEGLSPDDFSSQRMGAVFRAVQESGNEYDVLKISKVLQTWGFNIAVSELVGLQEYAFDGISLQSFRDEIKSNSQKRSLAHCLKINIEEIEKPGSDLTAIHDDLSKRLLDLQAGTTTEKILKRPVDFREEILNPKRSKAMITGIDSFDKLFGGFRPHELSCLTGETSSGKTTFAAAFLPYTLSQKGHPALIASFEMKPPQIQRKMVQMSMGHPFHELSRGEKEQGLDLIEDLPLHFIDAYGQIGLRELKGAIFRAHKQFEIDLVVLDHLHFFLKFSGDHERQAIDQALRDIKSWAMDLGIHIILIVHPTKLTYDNKVVHLNDLKGSSGLKQIPDNVLSIWRPRGEDNLKSPTSEIILYVLKVRDDDGDEGKVILTFDKRSQSYSDSGPDLARSAEEKRNLGPSSPSSRTLPRREWQNGYDS